MKTAIIIKGDVGKGTGSKFRFRVFLGLIVGWAVLCATVARGQYLYERLWSFGDPGAKGEAPWGSLLEGSDGALYGTTLSAAGGLGGAVFKVSKDGTGYRELKTFSATRQEGTGPRAALMRDHHGVLYGTTEEGGDGGGTIFKINEDGSGFAVLYRFKPGGTEGEGYFSNAPLVEDGNGGLHGSTLYGGPSAQGGVLFRLNKDGSEFQIMHRFDLGTTDGAYPYAGMILGTDGALYGATLLGGTMNLGTLFKIYPDGSGYTKLFDFDGTNGSWPRGKLVEDENGVLYGTTEQGGSTGNGTIFKINKDGTGHTILRHCGGQPDVEWPRGTLTLGRDGALYGASGYGGEIDQGTVFKLNRDGSGYEVLLRNTPEVDKPAHPFGGVIEGSDGRLYAPTFASQYASGAIFALQKDGTGFEVVHLFVNGGSDAKDPFSGVCVASDGAVYGASVWGGKHNLGAIFSFDPNGGGRRLVYSFGDRENDGRQSSALLIEGSDGRLYGTTAYGGAYGRGTIFGLNKDGSDYAILRSLGATLFDASQPDAGVIEGSDGILYGTTYVGGTTDGGAVFKINKDGTGYAVLQSLGLRADEGRAPSAPLCEGPDGVLYGTASQGGAYATGTLFKLNKGGGGYSTVHHFGEQNANVQDGANPLAPVFSAGDGWLYGTTFRGGKNGVGTIYRFAPGGGEYSLVYSLGVSEGVEPTAGVVEGPDGRLYGTATYVAAAPYLGNVFAVDKDGRNFTIVSRFDQVGDGSVPHAPVALGPDGYLYGTTSRGGDADLGTVFRIGLGHAVVKEGDANTTEAVVRVQLLSPAETEVSVRFATASGTAEADVDFIATNGVVTFQPGESSKAVAVSVLGDKLDEVLERFSIDFTPPEGVSLVHGQAIVAIADDDTALTILRQPVGLFLRPGSNALFNVVATSSAPPLRYQWTFNGVELPGATNASLLVANAQLTNDGAYRVVVQDMETRVLSEPAMLSILVPPVVEIAPLAQSVVAGGSVTFSVRIRGNPAPFTYELRHISAPTFTNTLVTDERTCFFTLNGVSATNAGNYRIVIRNAASPSPGVATPTFALTVLPDADRDGLPETWETSFGVTAPAGDDDGDGLSNLEEYQAGTSPTSAASTLRWESVARGSEATLTFNAAATKTYSVLSALGPDGEWSRLTNVVAHATNRVVTIIDASAGTNRFYRLVTPAQP